MPVAFFDLDRTLIRVNSGKLWVGYELRHGRLSRWQATRAAAWIFGYHLGYTKMEAVLQEGIGTLVDQTEDEVRARSRTFYEEEIRESFRPAARGVLARHREEGHTLALLTSSTEYLCAPVMEDLGISHVLCSRFEVVDGRFTGRADGPLCFGDGKLHHAQKFLTELGERMEDAWFYTDSASDLSVLEAVGHPVAVHPDPRLKRLALKRGWPVARWDETEPTAEPRARP